MSFTRKRLIEMDGVSVTVAPLTVSQTEEFLLEQGELLGIDQTTGKPVDPDAKPDAATFKKLEQLWYKFVAQGISNAGQIIAAQDIKSQMDKGLVDRLREEIMLMSGLNGKAVSGEAPTL